MKYDVAWTVPYQPSWIDKHEIEPELLCWATTIDASGADVSVLAYRRMVAGATLYEPVYFEFSIGDCEPTFQIGSVGANEVTLCRSLPEAVLLLALTRTNPTAEIMARPLPVRLELDEEAEEVGIGLSYALYSAKGEEPYVRGDYLPPLSHRVRTVYTDRYARQDPLYLHWGS